MTGEQALEQGQTATELTIGWHRPPFTGQDYQSALSEAAEEEVDDATAAGLEVDDSSDDGQPPFASVVRTTDNATAGPVSGDLLTPEACKCFVSCLSTAAPLTFSV